MTHFNKTYEPPSVPSFRACTARGVCRRILHADVIKPKGSRLLLRRSQETRKPASLRL